MKKSPPQYRIHLYAQHLLGSGHLVRMKALAACLADGGHEVVLISGGPAPPAPPDPRYALRQLPPLHAAAGDFTTLLEASGAPASPAYLERRAAQLLQVAAADAPDAPDAIVVETFPFGRRALQAELAALMQRLSAMRPRPLRLCSVRDILQTRSAARYRQTVAEVAAWFDHVLVHADPAVVTLAETFPLAAQLGASGDKIFYSGYLHAPAGHAPAGHAPAGHAADVAAPTGSSAPAQRAGEVIISAGGGAVGFELLQTALAARGRSALKARPWRLLTGAAMAAADFDALHRQAGGGLIVERHRADFPALLAACAVSVSQAGYNTVLDIVAAACRAVLIPFAQHGETEQTQRAEKFAALGRATLLREADLNAASLAAAVDAAAASEVAATPLNLNGGPASARFIEQQLQARRAP